MKNLRQLCAALILTLALAAPVFAGQIECPGITQEPTEQASTSDTEYGMTDVILSVLETVLSVV